MIGRRAVAAILILIEVASACSPPEHDSNVILARIIDRNRLEPLRTRPLNESPKYILGRALFFDPVLSGSRDMACSTCHTMEHATSDGRAVAVRAVDLTEPAKRGSIRQPAFPRNTPDLFNRDNDSVTSLFWDGRVEAEVEAGIVRFTSPQGRFDHRDFENILALQSVSPVSSRHEMLGNPGRRSASSLPPEHASRPNEIADLSDLPTGGHIALIAGGRLVDRLLGRSEETPAAWQLEYRGLIAAAYPYKSLAEYSFSDLANALAHFQELAFATRNTRWDKYLSGERGSLSEEEKLGAILFFGRGRCSVCHAGNLFSDFQFHSLGIVQRHSGRSFHDKTTVDFGRFLVTGVDADKYKFRTPPLRNVTLTAPYFHDGSADSLMAAVKQHAVPLAAAKEYDASGERVMPPDLIDSVSQVLLTSRPLEETEMELVVKFLASLEDAASLPSIRPTRVPSGLPPP